MNTDSAYLYEQAKRCLQWARYAFFSGDFPLALEWILLADRDRRLAREHRRFE